MTTSEQGSGAPRGAWGSSIGGLILVWAATVAVYGPGLSHPFHYDSVLKIERNPRLMEPESYVSALGAGGYRQAAGRLLTNLSYSLDLHLHGDDPWGFHLTDLLLHLAVIGLVFLFGRLLLLRLEGRADSPVPLLAAAVFALHPLNTEAVNYLNARPNQLVTLFYLAALTLLLVAPTVRAPWLRVVSWVGFGVSALAALASKELAASLALMAPLLHFWPARSDDGRQVGRAQLAILAALGVAALSVALATGALFEVERAVLRVGSSVSGHWTLYLGLTVLGQSEVFLRYLGLFLFPAPGWLNIDHRMVRHLHERIHRAGDTTPSLLGELVVPVASSALLVAVLVLAWRRRRTQPALSFLVLWPFVTHAPTSLVPRAEVMVEYRTYLPMVGLCLLAAWLCERLAMRFVVVTPVAWRLALAALLLSLTGATTVRNQTWRTQEALWRDSLEKSPDNFRAHHSLAAVLGEQGDEDAAVRHYERALELFPDDPEANNNLGNVFFRRGEVAGAIRLYRRALARRPRFVEALTNLGRALASRGQYPEAIGHYEEALAINPRQPETHNNLATALSYLGKNAAAREHFERALELDPELAEAHSNLAGLKLLDGDLTGAADGYQRALAVDPSLQSAYAGLGGVLARQKRYQEAAQVFLRAVELEPDNPVALNNLGGALAYLGDLAGAIARFQRAVELRPDYTDARNNLQRAMSLQAGDPVAPAQ